MKFYAKICTGSIFNSALASSFFYHLIVPEKKKRFLVGDCFIYYFVFFGYEILCWLEGITITVAHKNSSRIFPMKRNFLVFAYCFWVF